ncbi:glycosyltransferase [Clostridium tertium]|jgi:glycosyltransferase involved in cell wall biosynthesis|uniref:glycosyltransferase n=1 Tax=Clostridium tertium TaxID=1559 RepID=UPI000DCFBFC7|nr:glycosyltransferase [Clostridium tertium]
MKVLHLTTTDGLTGSAKAVVRLNEALINKNINSRVLVKNKQSSSSDINSIYNTDIGKHFLSKLGNLIEKCQQIKYKNKEDIIFSTGFFGINILSNRLIKESDVIILHWINSAFISIKSIKKLCGLNKKIMFYLHDSWLFTGGCHVRYSCEKYKVNCGNCPILNSGIDNDLSRKVWGKKYKYFKELDFEIIVPSMWMKECAEESSILREKKITVIPNALNTDLYKIIDKQFARSLFNLPKDKKIILFGAVNSIKTPYKGYEYLIKSLEFIKDKYSNLDENILYVVFGADKPMDTRLKGVTNIKFLGEFRDEYSLSALYNAADVYVNPSLQESFGQTIIESLSCGTPVVAFNYSGPVDIINHKQNGYLAKYKDYEDLSSGILWCLGNGRINKECRNTVIRQYSYPVISEKYIYNFNIK